MRRESNSYCIRPLRSTRLDDMCNERGASLIGIVLGLAILGIGAGVILSRYANDSVDAVAGAGVPLDETRRQRTITDMRTLGQAIALMQADRGAYPATLAELERSLAELIP